MRHLALALAVSCALLGCQGEKAPADGAVDASAPPHIGPFADLVEAPAPAPSERPTRVGVEHLLVAFKGAELASPAVTRTKEQAKARAEEAMAKLRLDKSAFPEVVRDYSDDETTKRGGGALGNIEAWAMPEAFYEAARALPVGGVSEVVETPRGYHIVRRTR